MTLNLRDKRRKSFKGFFKVALVVAQVEEQQISVQASRVQCPGGPWLFLADCLYSHWALGFYSYKNKS